MHKELPFLRKFDFNRSHFVFTDVFRSLWKARRFPKDEMLIKLFLFFFQLYKILDDLEYVAANLNGSDERVVTTVKPKDLVDVALYKTEAKKAKDDCLVLKRNYLKLEKKVESLEGMIKSKDLEIKELNSVINPLKRNGNDMLRTLSAKANIEDKVKTMEKKLNGTQQQLAAEKFTNQQMELKCKSADNA